MAMQSGAENQLYLDTVQKSAFLNSLLFATTSDENQFPVLHYGENKLLCALCRKQSYNLALFRESIVIQHCSENQL
jgi:hypothetical protein